MSDPMDVSFGRWLKSGMRGRRPPEAARERLLRAAALRKSGLDRSHLKADAFNRTKAVGPDAWSFGVAALAAMEWFPGEATVFRVAY